MNKEQVKGIAERLVLMGLTFAAGRGLIPGEWVPDITAAVVAIIAVLWGWKVNTAPSLASAAASLPEVKKVVMSDRVVAEADPNPKITGGL